MRLTRENSVEAQKRLRNQIREGEHLSQDFKFAINNSKKIAISLSAFANTAGGKLLIGVKDNGKIAGVHAEDEVHMMEGAADLYCDPAVPLDMCIIELEDGKEVLEAEVMPMPGAAVRAFTPEGQWRAFVRDADENFLASPLHLELWKREKKKPTNNPSTFGDEEKAFLRLLAERDEWRLNALIRKSGMPRKRALRHLGDFLYWELLELFRSDNEYRLRSK